MRTLFSDRVDGNLCAQSDCSFCCLFALGYSFSVTCQQLFIKFHDYLHIDTDFLSYEVVLLISICIYLQLYLKLFNKMRSDTHCINSLLPCNKTNVYGLRDREHHFELPPWHLIYIVYFLVSGGRKIALGLLTFLSLETENSALST